MVTNPILLSSSEFVKPDERVPLIPGKKLRGWGQQAEEANLNNRRVARKKLGLLTRSTNSTGPR